MCNSPTAAITVESILVSTHCSVCFRATVIVCVSDSGSVDPAVTFSGESVAFGPGFDLWLFGIFWEFYVQPNQHFRDTFAPRGRRGENNVLNVLSKQSSENCVLTCRCSYVPPGNHLEHIRHTCIWRLSLMCVNKGPMYYCLSEQVSITCFWLPLEGHMKYFEFNKDMFYFERTLK